MKKKVIGLLLSFVLLFSNAAIVSAEEGISPLPFGEGEVSLEELDAYNLSPLSSYPPSWAVPRSAAYYNGGAIAMAESGQITGADNVAQLMERFMWEIFYTPEELQRHQQIYDQMRQITNSIISGQTTQRGKAKAIHDWIRGNISLAGHSRPWNPFECFVNRNATPNEGSEIAVLMMNHAGIECINVNGDWASSPFATVSSANGYSPTHIWNMIKVDGAWYFMDLAKGDSQFMKTPLDFGSQYDGRFALELGSWFGYIDVEPGVPAELYAFIDDLFWADGARESVDVLIDSLYRGEKNVFRLALDYFSYGGSYWRIRLRSAGYVNSDLVTIAFKGLLGRVPSVGEVENIINQLGYSAKIPSEIYAIANTNEFKTRCNRMGVPHGF